MPTPTAPDWEDLGATYGFSVSFLNHHPELKRIVQHAIRDDRDDAWITARVRGTHWYRTTSETYRKTQVLRATDPAEYNSQVRQMMQHVQNVYATTIGHTPSSSWAKNIATQAVNFGWTDEQLQNMVHQGAGIYGALHRGELGGEAGDMEDQARQYARDMGVDVSDSWLASSIAHAVRGGFGVTHVKDGIMKMAKSQYSAFSDDLDGGVTMKDIAEPFVQMMAKEWEVPPNQVGLDNKYVKQALGRRVTNKDGKSIGDPMSLWEFQKVLRSNPKWSQTQGAQDQLMSIGHDILQKMGVVS